MADTDKPGLFALVCICAVFLHTVFLALIVQQHQENDHCIRRAYQLFFAGLFILSNLGWLVYVCLWDNWHIAVTWEQNTFIVAGVNTIQNAAVAPTLTFEHNPSGELGSFAWVLPTRGTLEYENLLNIYQTNYSFSAYQNPNDLADIQLSVNTNPAALTITIVFLLGLFFIWSSMVRVWYESESPPSSNHLLPPAYEGVVMEIVHLPPPAYNEQATTTVVVENAM